VKDSAFQLSPRAKRQLIRRRYALATDKKGYGDIPVESIVEHGAILLHVDVEPSSPRDDSVDVVMHDCKDCPATKNGKSCKITETCCSVILSEWGNYSPCINQYLTPPEARYFLGVPWLCRICPQRPPQGNCDALIPRSPNEPMMLYVLRCPQHVYPVPTIPPVCDDCSDKLTCTVLDHILETVYYSSGDTNGGPFMTDLLVPQCPVLRARYPNGIKPAAMRQMYAKRVENNSDLKELLDKWEKEYKQAERHEAEAGDDDTA